MINLLMTIGLILAWLVVAGVMLYFAYFLGHDTAHKPHPKKYIDAYTNAQAKNKYLENESTKQKEK